MPEREAAGACNLMTFLFFPQNSKYFPGLSQHVFDDGRDLTSAQAGFLRGKYIHFKIGPDATFLARLGNVYLPGILE
jgi:hypothetical protein